MPLINHAAVIVGKTPREKGCNFNLWKKGDKQVYQETVFHDAKKSGCKTYFYIYENLGFLVKSAVDLAAI